MQVEQFGRALNPGEFDNLPEPEKSARREAAVNALIEKVENRYLETQRRSTG